MRLLAEAFCFTENMTKIEDVNFDILRVDHIVSCRLILGNGRRGPSFVATLATRNVLPVMRCLFDKLIKWPALSHEARRFV